jgi:hypothetical protein
MKQLCKGVQNVKFHEWTTVTFQNFRSRRNHRATHATEVGEELVVRKIFSFISTEQNNRKYTSKFGDPNPDIY